MISVIIILGVMISTLVWLCVGSAKEQATRRSIDKKTNEMMDQISEKARNASSLKDFEEVLTELDRKTDGIKVFYFPDTARRFQIIRAWLQGAIEGWKRRDL